MIGPFEVVGDCINEYEHRAIAFIDREPIRDGDLGIWYMPSREPGEQYASKLLIADSAGCFWLACKYFAVRYRPDFHVPVARVVKIMGAEIGSSSPKLSAKMAAEILTLRATRPQRDDLVVFPEDILEHGAIVAAIDQHRRQSN